MDHKFIIMLEPGGFGVTEIIFDDMGSLLTMKPSLGTASPYGFDPMQIKQGDSITFHNGVLGEGKEVKPQKVKGVYKQIR